MNARLHTSIKGTEFVWDGGDYIDVGRTHAIGTPGAHGNDFHAYDVITVWDSPIDRTLEAFEERCREYIECSQ